MNIETFNEGMSACYKAYNTTLDPEKEAEYWDAISIWPSGLFKETVYRLVSVAKPGEKIPSFQTFKETRAKLVIEEYPSEGTPLGKLFPASRRRFFECLALRAHDPSIQFMVHESDFILKSDWLTYHSKHPNEPTENPLQIATETFGPRPNAEPISTAMNQLANKAEEEGIPF